jgi:hypothetical protein
MGNTLDFQKPAVHQYPQTLHSGLAISPISYLQSRSSPAVKQRDLRLDFGVPFK